MTRDIRACAVAVSGMLLLVLTACGGAGSGRTVEPPGSVGSAASSTSPTSGSNITPGVTDPEHAVDPPGPRRGALVGADLLIKNESTLGAPLVRRIRGLATVKRSLVLSLGNVGIENRVINLGAVDPSTYRNYTPYVSAELQQAWDRVAGGELVIDKSLGRRLQDDEGFLKLGNDQDAPQVHIGAFAPQVPQIDAVVNESWGEQLGLPSDNAMLISTGIHSPRVVMADLQQIVGDDAVVSILGPDLDPGAQQLAIPSGGSVAAAVGAFRYTVLGAERVAPEQSWVAAHIRTEQVPILGNVTCHAVIIPQLRAALREVQSRGLAQEIHPQEYAGCYYPRYIAGTQQLSLHAFGIALDLNVSGNQRGSAGEMDRTVVEIFKKWGFAWGGDWGYTDPMHFELNALIDPTAPR